MVFSIVRKALAPLSGGPSRLPQDFITKIVDSNRYTPDLPILEATSIHPLFVFGDEMLNHERHDIFLKDNYFHKPCTAFTFEPFTMWKKSLGKLSSPFITSPNLSFMHRHWFKSQHIKQDATGEYRPIAAQIKGELYFVTPQALKQLDIYRLNTVQSTRQKVRILIPYRDANDVTVYTSSIEAWAYVGIDAYWEDIVETSLLTDQGTYKLAHQFKNEFYQHKCRHYYYFTKQDYFEWPKERVL